MSGKELNLQSAMEDVSTIKQTLEKSKVQFGKLATLFLIFGVTQLCVYVFQQIGELLFIKNELFSGVEILYWFKYITLAILSVFYIKMRKEIKISNNIYTLKLFDIWGYILFIIPLVRFLIIIVHFVVFRKSVIDTIALFSYSALSMIEYTSVIIGVLVTGCFLNKLELKIASVVLLFVYPILFFINVNNIVIDDCLSVYGYFSQVNSLFYIIILFVYIGVGMDFKICNGGGKIGIK